MTDKETEQLHNNFVETLQDEQAIIPQIGLVQSSSIGEQNTSNDVLCKEKKKNLFDFVKGLFTIKKRNFNSGYWTMRIGYIDPLQLSFNIMNNLIAKELLTLDESMEIIRGSLPPDLPLEEQDRFLNSILAPTNTDNGGNEEQNTSE